MVTTHTVGTASLLTKRREHMHAMDKVQTTLLYSLIASTAAVATRSATVSALAAESTALPVSRKNRWLLEVPLGSLPVLCNSTILVLNRSQTADHL